MCLGFLENHKEKFYLVFRILIGIFFLVNGLKKFGILGGTSAAFMSQMWFAGVIEIAVGLFVTIGLFTSWFALLGIAMMIAAYYVAHVPRGMNPFLNGGEKAILYLLAFIVIFAYGAQKYSIDSLWKKN